MDYSSLSSSNAPSTPSYPSEELVNCPSSPHPRRRKLQMTFNNEHVMIPLHISNSNGSPTELKKIPMSDFPSLPFDFPKPPLNNTPSDGSSPGAPLRSATTPSSSSDKLSSPQRNKKLACFNRRRKSVGARCA
eukprot:CAMPEP_0172299932 /NCGR_PEP_ID=MMETSP1058-20130122/2122_1 /TAXON_ID=83371 /ORGANISM="Detonula confervacea, Strain CCMP 353" /LENGTH=132 /DNA_ID=CAMNT_0013009549 /DNA_START=54 /DNA_END=452 /DNA_ORIENTATION=+